MIDIDLTFIGDTTQEKIISSDIQELHTVMNGNAHKASLVLIGSLIESMLFYFIDNNEHIKSTIINFDKRKLGLSDLLQLARKNAVISEELFRLSEPIRDFRNTIHPKVQSRIGEEVINESNVQIGYNILLEIIRYLRSKSDYAITKEYEHIINEILKSELGDEADDIDYFVYIPVLKKYNKRIGSLIIRRSIQYANE